MCAYFGSPLTICRRTYVPATSFGRIWIPVILLGTDCEIRKFHTLFEYFEYFPWAVYSVWLREMGRNHIYAVFRAVQKLCFAVRVLFPSQPPLGSTQAEKRRDVCAVIRVSLFSTGLIGRLNNSSDACTSIKHVVQRSNSNMADARKDPLKFHVGSLNFNTTEATLYDAFGEYGKVEKGKSWLLLLKISKRRRHLKSSFGSMRFSVRVVLVFFYREMTYWSI